MLVATKLANMVLLATDEAEAEGAAVDEDEVEFEPEARISFTQ